MRGLRVTVGLLCLFVAACGSGGSGGADVPDVAGDVAAGDSLESRGEVGVDSVQQDVVSDLPGVLEMVAVLEVAEAESSDPCPGCPEGYCDEDSGQCKYCDDGTYCTGPQQWCLNNMCVETLCIPGNKMCKSDEVSQTCVQDGESWQEVPCEGELVCAVGECQEVICAPGEKYCEKGMVVQCDPKGVGWLKFPCPPGNGCFVDQCQPIQHNLLVIFDTSGSMASIGFMDTVPCICPSGCSAKPFPVCEDPLCPQSKLGLAKHVFSKFFESEQLGIVNIVLTHFAQRIRYPPTLQCTNLFAMARGWYGMDMMSSDWITGDDGSHVTDEGGWFDQYLYEILSVPFPATWDEDTVEALQSWVNFNEEVGPTETACTAIKDCPGGFCAPGEDGQKVCWYHTDPELRALTGTPLGRSMFYAGEVYRKQIMVNGKSCQTDADCNNRNYYCSSKGLCKDPFAHCRQNMILMFTDGVESPETSLSEFFNPRVQAKRFRYGLGCDGDDDCFEDAVCSGGRCSEYPQPNTGGTTVPPNTEAPWRLEDYQGAPVMITTHVIDMSSGEGEGPNKHLADDGGGSYYHADDLDPDELLEQMLKLLDIKQNLQDCVPDFEE
jgi:hypothetical protein